MSFSKGHPALNIEARYYSAEEHKTVKQGPDLENRSAGEEASQIHVSPFRNLTYIIRNVPFRNPSLSFHETLGCSDIKSLTEGEGKTR